MYAHSVYKRLPVVQNFVHVKLFAMILGLTLSAIVFTTAKNKFWGLQVLSNIENTNLIRYCSNRLCQIIIDSTYYLDIVDFVKI